MINIVNNNPVFHWDGGDMEDPITGSPAPIPAGWYFFNELWSDIYGPFDTEEEANQGCKEYADSLEVVTVDDN